MNILRDLLLDKREYWRTYRDKLTNDVFSHYSPGIIKCVLCPEIRFGALTIDHIAGGGRQHREILKLVGSGIHFYRWLRMNNYPVGYRVLCSNCNWKSYLSTIERVPENEAVKLELMNRLGGKCVECNIDDLDLLTIHHINNDGRAHRRLLKDQNGGASFYKKLLKLGNFDGLECRCLSCNDNIAKVLSTILAGSEKSLQ